jgi:type II secretory pathway component PulM
MTLTDAWRQRSAAERRTYALLATFIGTVLLVTFVWLPLERTRARLAADLPTMRGSIAALERDAAEVKRLRALPVSKPAASAPLASLATNAGGLPGAQVTVMDDRHVRVTGPDVGFSALLKWLQDAQATHGMRVESARLDALPAAGRVRAELVLVRA